MHKNMTGKRVILSINCRRAGMISALSLKSLTTMNHSLSRSLGSRICVDRLYFCCWWRTIRRSGSRIVPVRDQITAVEVGFVLATRMASNLSLVYPHFCETSRLVQRKRCYLLVIKYAQIFTRDKQEPIVWRKKTKQSSDLGVGSTWRPYKQPPPR